MQKPVLEARTLSTITVKWTAFTEGTTGTGNSPILSYELKWDSGSGSVIYTLTDTLVTQYTVTGLTGGAEYKFKVRARNIYGYSSDYSDTTTIQASHVPQVMPILTTEIDIS